MSVDWPHRLDEVGESPSSRALRSGHARVITMILNVAEDRAEPDAGVSELIQCARNCDVKGVRECMERGDNFEKPDKHGLTPMHWAAITGCMDLARLLVNRGAQVNPRDTRLTDLTPLNIARLMRYDELVRFLVNHGGLE